MSEDGTHREPLTLTERAKIARAGVREDFWVCVVVPELERRLARHTEACCDPDLAPHKRGEHIEARRLAMDLLALPETLLRVAAEKNGGCAPNRHRGR